jgi:hypothetical protein
LYAYQGASHTISAHSAATEADELSINVGDVITLISKGTCPPFGAD